MNCRLVCATFRPSHGRLVAANDEIGPPARPLARLCASVFVKGLPASQPAGQPSGQEAQKRPRCVHLLRAFVSGAQCILGSQQLHAGQPASQQASKLARAR